MHLRSQAISHLLAFLLLSCVLGSLRSSPTSTLDQHGKAVFGPQRADVFDPTVYEAILAATRSAAAVAQVGATKPHASGVLIARDTVLTARHVTFRSANGAQRYTPRQLEVRFDYRKRADGSISAPTRWRVIAYEEIAVGRDALLLKLAPHGADQFPAAERVQTLASTRAALDEPVVVIGYGKGDPVQIADDARVLFPQQATQDELDTILSREPASFHELIRWSYRTRVGSTYTNLSTTYGNHPTLGIDSDTVAGMSGAGVYLKRTGELIGILYDGQPDAPTPWAASWHRHEAVFIPLVPTESLSARSAKGS